MSDTKKLIVEIPLRPKADGDVFVDKDGRAPLELEYASRMLEAIDAHPSAANVKWILQKVPLEGAMVVPMKTRDVIMLVPGAADGKMDLAQLMGVSDSDAGEFKDEKKKKEERDALAREQEAENARNQDIRDDEEQRRVAQANVARGRRVSWCTVHTYDFLYPIVDVVGVKEVETRLFRAMLRPLSITKEDLAVPVGVFNAALVEYVPSVKDDKTGHLFSKVQHFLESEECMQLYGLLAHYVYWNIIHPSIRRACLHARVIDPFDAPPRTTVMTSIGEQGGMDDSKSVMTQGDGVTLGGGMTTGGFDSLASQTSLSQDEKEVLFVHLQKCYVLLKTVTGANKTALATMHQGLICCSHFAVDVALCEEYQWFDAERSAHLVNLDYIDPGPVNTLRLEMRRLMHQSVADLVDPSRLYTDRFLELSAVGKTKVAIKPNGNDSMNQYATSVAVRALLRGEARDSRTRILLHHGDKKPYANVPGLMPASHGGHIDRSASMASLERAASARVGLIGEELEKVAPGTPHPVFGGATNHKDKSFAWVRDNVRFRKVENFNRGARGPHGRMDGVPDGGTQEGHVGEMLRIATVPRKALVRALTKRAPPPLRTVIAPGGKVLLVRSKSGQLQKEQTSSCKDPHKVDVSALDAKDLFGSYAKLHKERDDYVKAEIQPPGEDYVFDPYDPNGGGGGGGALSEGLDGGDSFMSDGLGLQSVRPAGSSGAGAGGNSRLQADASPRGPRLEPLSHNGKRDLLQLVVEKTKKAYMNPALCMTDRIALLDPNKQPGSNGH